MSDDLPETAPEVGTIFRNGDIGDCTVTKVWLSRFDDWKVSYADKRGGGGLMTLERFLSLHNAIGQARRGQAKFNQTASSASPAPTCYPSSLVDFSGRCMKIEIQEGGVVVAYIEDGILIGDAGKVKLAYAIMSKIQDQKR